MSRTYKDRPYKVKFPDWYREDKYESFEYELETPRLLWNGKLITNTAFSVKRAGVIAKKRRNCDHEGRYLQSTPSWWTSMFMNRPQRIASKRWEREIVNYSLWDLAQDNFDPPHVGNKPHIYYW